MALNYQQIYEDSLLGDKQPPKGLFKKQYLLEFVTIYSGEFLHCIQNPKAQKTWLINSGVYKKLFLFYYKNSFSDFSLFFLRTYDSSRYDQNDLLMGVLENLLEQNPDSTIPFLKLIASKNVQFDNLEQRQYLQLFYLVHFFDFSLSEKTYYVEQLIDVLPSNFLANKDLYFILQPEIEELSKEQSYESLVELIKCIVSQNQEAIDKSYLNFLLNYQNFSSGLSRAFSKYQKTSKQSHNLLKQSNDAGVLNINWLYLTARPQETELRNLLSFLKDRARKTFFRDFVLAMVLTLVLAYFFEPQNLVFWVIVCVVANVCEYYFAHYKLNKIYYMYRLKMPCLSYMANLHPLLLYMDFEGIELEDSYELQLLQGLRKDPWLFFPARF